ncbi:MULTISPECIES: hypothetical protein [Bradyrhizobium]|jgi:hypothetical protein|uniref:hypothetical protein n=1 Tax=Bradyrhizobium TaxID=374 RepID=UPI0027150490|nr:hypothetical protein [Bradyrhizobium elkanii]WLA46714.1 hypothetical protein QIH80_34000 [Bradyrhizobium elkanii]WLB83000.1 hypothetical protein QIH83_10735 [Bradyrhizobium elkanii]
MATFGGEQGLLKISKESWFRFMDWTWIGFMICGVKARSMINRKIDPMALICSSIESALDASARSRSQTIR